MEQMFFLVLDQSPTGAMYDALRNSGGTGRIHDVQGGGEREVFVARLCSFHE